MQRIPRDRENASGFQYVRESISQRRAQMLVRTYYLPSSEFKNGIVKSCVGASVRRSAEAGRPTINFDGSSAREFVAIETEYHNLLFHHALDEDRAAVPAPRRALAPM